MHYFTVSADVNDIGFFEKLNKHLIEFSNINTLGYIYVICTEEDCLQ